MFFVKYEQNSIAAATAFNMLKGGDKCPTKENF